MKQTLLFLSVIVVTALTAQPTFTVQDMFGVGKTYDVMKFDPAEFSTELTGEDADWDYTDITSTGTHADTAADATGEPGADAFPSATVTFQGQSEFDGTFYEFFQISEASYALNGRYNTYDNSPFPPGLGPWVYNPALDIFRFPSTYTTTFEQDIEATQAVGPGSRFRKGSQTVTFDGYGTLRTPAGVYTDALRFHTHQEYYDSLWYPDARSVERDYLVDIYSWISPHTEGVILLNKRIERVYEEGQEIPMEYITAYYTNPSVSHVGLSRLSAGAFELFPNPAKGSVMLAGARAGETIIADLYTPAGQLVARLYQGAASGQVQLVLPALASGLYFVQISSNGAQAVRKLVIE